MAYRLLVGLGNPGSQYNHTRHNIGFAVLDWIGALHSVSFREEARGPVEWARLEEARLLKPLTYMNATGEAVRVWLEWLKLTPADLLVVVDDLSLPLGQLRLRESGSHGGHNGLRSIEEEIGTVSYARIRCGIGPLPTGREMKSFVLEKFAKEEKERVQRMIESAAAAFQCCQKQGISIAMKDFNTKQHEKIEENE